MTTPVLLVLASSRQDDVEDQFLSIKNSWNEDNDNTNTVYRSDVPSDKDSNSNINYMPELSAQFQTLKDKYWKLPPRPEDQFIMTGDICTLFLYAFTSHSLNDAVVLGLLDDPTLTIPAAVSELDPMHDIVQLQPPVWVDLVAGNPNIPFGNPAVDHALAVSARESLLNHWGPLLGTEGGSCVALCLCWLLAGWIHRSFLFDNSTCCDSHTALFKTVETWGTAALLLASLAAGTNVLVGQVPVLQSLLVGGGVEGQQQYFATALLTQSDVFFIVDSLTVLIAWRWLAHRILNIYN